MQEVAADRRAAAADVATPRPREVGGACRIQVLAAARTQETVGGPNEATRSEFRRRCPAVDVKSLPMHYMLEQLQRPQNRHYSVLGPLYLKIKVSKLVTLVRRAHRRAQGENPVFRIAKKYVLLNS